LNNEASRFEHAQIFIPRNGITFRAYDCRILGVTQYFQMSQRSSMFGFQWREGITHSTEVDGLPVSEKFVYHRIYFAMPNPLKATPQQFCTRNLHRAVVDVAPTRFCKTVMAVKLAP
jgi:hypothetical protein